MDKERSNAEDSTSSASTENRLTFVLRATSSSSRETLISRVCCDEASQYRHAPGRTCRLTCTLSLCNCSIFSSYLRTGNSAIVDAVAAAGCEGKRSPGAHTAVMSCSFAAHTRPSTAAPGVKATKLRQQQLGRSRAPAAAAAATQHRCGTRCRRAQQTRRGRRRSNSNATAAARSLQTE